METLVGSATWTTAGGTAIGTKGLFGAAGSFTSQSLLSGALTAASAFGELQAGAMDAENLKLTSRQSELNARLETLKGRQQALQIRQQLERSLAGQNATFAARGVLQGEGSAGAAADVSKENAEEDINNAMFGAELQSSGERLRATQNRTNAAAAYRSGATSAVKVIANSRTFRNAGYSLLES